MTAIFELYVPPTVARRLLRLRRSVRDAVSLRLQEVLKAAEVKGSSAPEEAAIPTPRIYAEDYRVFYQVEPRSRRVVVIDVQRTFR